MKLMHKRLLLVLQSLLQRIKGILTTILHSDFTTTQARVGSGLALLYLVTGEPRVVYLLAVFSIMFLTQGVGYLIITMRTYGWQVAVEAWVDIGVLLEVMVFQLLTVVSLLVASLSCT
jgi:hypothetical protein